MEKKSDEEGNESFLEFPTNHNGIGAVRKKGELEGIFDSQTENFLSQRVQSANSTETEFC